MGNMHTSNKRTPENKNILNIITQRVRRGINKKKIKTEKTENGSTTNKKRKENVFTLKKMQVNEEINLEKSYKEEIKLVRYITGKKTPDFDIILDETRGIIKSIVSKLFE